MAPQGQLHLCTVHFPPVGDMGTQSWRGAAPHKTLVGKIQFKVICRPCETRTKVLFHWLLHLGEWRRHWYRDRLTCSLAARSTAYLPLYTNTHTHSTHTAHRHRHAHCFFAAFNGIDGLFASTSVACIHQEIGRASCRDRV